MLEPACRLNVDGGPLSIRAAAGAPTVGPEMEESMSTVDRKAAVAALQRIGKGVSTRPGIPALTGVKMTADAGRITLEGTDLEMHVRAVIDFDGPWESWAALVPAKLLTAALKASSAERVTFGPADIGPASGVAGAATAAFRAADATLRCLPIEDWPTLEMPTGAVNLAPQGYRAAVLAVLPAVSSDEARPVLTGMLHESDGSTLTLVGTDSYRLHVSELPSLTGETYKAVIPGRALKAIAGMIGKRMSEPIGFRAGDSVAVWHLPDGTSVSCRLIEGEYPNYRQLMPDVDPTADGTPRNADYGRLTFEPGPMLEAIAAAGAVCRDTTPLRLELNGRVDVSGSSPDLGTTLVTVGGATWTGEDVVTGFNPVYLGDAIRSVGASTLYVRDGLKPAVAVGPDGTALVMPVRLAAA